MGQEVEQVCPGVVGGIEGQDGVVNAVLVRGGEGVGHRLGSRRMGEERRGWTYGGGA